jgi:predicted site-specific integrase-resolvase
MGKEIYNTHKQIEEKWMSVSEYAKKRGVTTMTVYNWIAQGLVEHMDFQRGKMNGRLVRSKQNEL